MMTVHLIVRKKTLRLEILKEAEIAAEKSPKRRRKAKEEKTVTELMMPLHLAIDPVMILLGPAVKLPVEMIPLAVKVV